MNGLWAWLTAAIAVIALAALGLWLAFRDGGQGLSALGGGQLVPAHAYDVIDADTIVVASLTGQGAWTRITNVVESASEVRVSIRFLRWPMGTFTNEGYPIEWTLDLNDPLGDRVVHDGIHPVPRAEPAG